MAYIIERDWTTHAGFRAVVIMVDMGHRCGYVGVPKGHPLYGVSYSEQCDALTFPADESIGKRGIIPVFCSDGEKASPEIVFDVHGGITYSGGNDEYPVESDLWWFGYDCSHAGDSPSPEVVADRIKRMGSIFRPGPDEVHRSLDYCSSECESLAAQLVSRVRAAETVDAASADGSRRATRSASVRPEAESDPICVEADGCPTEMAVLKRFWREHQAADQSSIADEAREGK